MAELYVPETLEDAIGFLAGHDGVATPIAGGTDVLIDTRLGRIHPEWLVDLSPLDSLAGIAEEGDVLRSYELGVNAYVVKPVKFQEFVDAVRQVGAFWAVINEPPPGSLRHSDSARS